MKSETGLFGLFDRAMGRVALVADNLAALVCAILITATTGSVIIYHQGIAIPWLDDLLRMLLIWLVYLGSVTLCFRNDHITMDAVYLRMTPRVQRGMNFIVAVLGFVLCAYISTMGLESMLREIEYGTTLPAGYIPAWPQTLAIPLCFAVMALAYLSYLYSVVKRRDRSTNPQSPAGGS